MMFGEVLLSAAGLFLGTVGATALVGGVRWVGKVSDAVDGLAATAAKLTAISEEQIRIRAELALHVREADDRWARLGAVIPHPRYTEQRTDDRPPAVLP